MSQDNFSQIFPEHPHRRLHILVSILAFVLIVGSIAIYQINRVEDVIQVVPSPIPKSTELTAQQRQQAISQLKETVSKSPPLTDKQRANAILELKKTIANQNK